MLGEARDLILAPTRIRRAPSTGADRALKQDVRPSSAILACHHESGESPGASSVWSQHLVKGDRIRIVPRSRSSLTSTLLAGSLGPATGCGSDVRTPEANRLARRRRRASRRSTCRLHRRLLRDGAAQGPRGPGQGHDRGPAARHHDVGPLRRVRPALPQAGVRGRRPDARTSSRSTTRRAARRRCRRQAEADITAGASVLLVDAIDSGSGAAIEATPSKPASRSSTTTAWSRAARRTGTTSASTTWRSARLIGQGVVDCVDRLERARTRTSS